MSEAEHTRPGLAPVPGRVPPLPGAAGTRVSPASPPPAAAAAPPDLSRRPGRASYRAIEAQVDAEIRTYLLETTFAIARRTDSAFDRSMLIRGILRAVARSGIDLSACEAEDQITEALSRHLPPGHSR